MTFFENFPPTLRVLKKNILNLNCSKNTKIIEKDIFCLKKSNLNLMNYEYIFLDPPYKELRIKLLIKILKNCKILKSDGIVIIHRDKKFIDEFPEDFKVIISKNYGRSKIFFW